MFAGLADLEQSARNVARQLDAKSAKSLVARCLKAPIGSLDADKNADPKWSRAVWINEIARLHPCVIPHLVEALTSENAIGEWFPALLGWVGHARPLVSGLLMPLFDHESVAVRDAAFSACTSTGLMPVEAIPRLIEAFLESDASADTLQYTLRSAADSHPSEVISALVDTPGARGLDAFYDISEVGGPATEVIVEELTRLLGSPDAEKRRAAASALGSMESKAKQAVARLRPLLDDDDPRVRKAASAAIQQISDAPARYGWEAPDQGDVG
jgi:hypothetical protein